jgi:hypothetical protein
VLLWQKQYSSALVRFLALARAEVFQFSPYIAHGFLSSSSVFLLAGRQVGQRFWAEDFQIPQQHKTLSLVVIVKTLRMKTYCNDNELRKWWTL